MKLIFFLAIATILPGQPATDADKNRLAELNRAADQYLASYDLDKAQPVVEQALEVAARLGSVYESAAHARLYDVYLEFHKRDGRSWCNIALPHLLKALEFAKTASGDMAGQLAAKYASALLDVTPAEIRAEVSAQFAPFLQHWVTEIEAKSAPLDPGTAVAYHALAHFPDRSPEQMQALNACDLLSQLDKIALEFSTLLADCAGVKQRTGSNADAIRLASLARQTAIPGGRGWAYETIRSYIFESQADLASGEFSKGVEAADAGIKEARNALAPGHGFWAALLTTRAALLDGLHQRQAASRARHDLKDWLNQRDKRLAEARLQIPRVIKQLQPVGRASESLNDYAGGFIRVLAQITPEGNVQVVTTFGQLPFGLAASALKAVSEWKFRPYLLDGKPVAGITTLLVSVGPRN